MKNTGNILDQCEDRVSEIEYKVDRVHHKLSDRPKMTRHQASWTQWLLDDSKKKNQNKTEKSLMEL